MTLATCGVCHECQAHVSALHHILHAYVATPGHSVSHHNDDHHLKPDSPVPAPRKTRTKEKPKEKEKV